MTYSGNNRRNARSYFRQLPDLEYPSLSNERESIYDYNRVKNFFRRAVIRDDILESYVTFEKYLVQGSERPDNVAYKVYGDSQLDWVVLLVNNITSVRDQWPMPEGDFSNYLNDKYTEEQLSYIHHYETMTILDGQGKLIQPAGYYVGPDHSVTFIDDGVNRTETKIKSVSYLQHEIAQNDAKREIDILKPEFLTTVLKDIKNIMQYDVSNQYINEKLKRTENPRISSPR